MADDGGKPRPGRGARGRFAKGHSGNPAGRPPGRLNEATRIAAGLLDGEAQALTRKAIDLALAGEPVPLRLCLDPIVAPLKKQPIAFALPRIRRPADIPAAAAAIGDAASSGLVTPEEAESLAQMLESQARAMAIAERLKADRIAARQVGVSQRFDLRACLICAEEAREIRDAAEDIDPRLTSLCRAVEEIGRAAVAMLVALPDTRELALSDRAYLAAHPLPPERPRLPLFAELSNAFLPLFNYLNANATRIDQLLEWRDQERQRNQ